jgi:hypothetical protein
MTGTDITAVVSILVTVCGVIIIPLWVIMRQRKKDRTVTVETTGMVGLTGLNDLNKALQADIKRLREQLHESEHQYQRQLDDMSTKHREQIKTMDSDWESRMATQQVRMAGLENQIVVLNQQLTQALRGGGSLS